MVAALTEKFAGMDEWPAAQVKAVIGVDPTSIPSIQKFAGRHDFPQVDPVTRLLNCITGDPMLGFDVEGADVIAWVEAQT